jgi:GTPase
MYKPEFLRKEGMFLLREGQTRIVGFIKRIVTDQKELD